jgi:hypothetical protein
MTPLRLAWARYTYFESGNHAGYRQMTDRLKAELTSRLTWDADASTVLHIVSPPGFIPIRNRRNVLFTMWETPDFPQNAIDRVRLADVLIVPSTFCARIFRRYTRAPIHVCPLGVDPQPVPARRFDVPFRWLWCGAQNPRKGGQMLALTWDRHFAQTPGLELYMKTTFIDASYGKLERNGSLIYDSRTVSRSEMDGLYASAHAFIYPTMGEGYGLTLLEAMASGLPCVATDYSGHRDFATAANCVLVPARVQRLELDPKHKSAAPDGRHAFATMTAEHLARAMLRVMRDYDAALAMGRRAAKTARALTWQASAQRLRAILAREARSAPRVAA